MNLNKTPRQKTARLVVAFETTEDALEAEKVLSSLPRTNANCGRLIPVPRNVSAGCGMAWKDELSLKDKIIKTLESSKIDGASLHEIEFLERK